MTTPETIATERSQPGTFSLIERLQGRGMPTEDVVIYLDEKLGWDLVRLEEKHTKAKKDAEAKALEEKIAKVNRQLQDSKYVFTIQGMSNERYDDLIDQVTEQWPYEYEEALNPLTGEKIKTLIDNEERDSLFNVLFLAESVQKVTDPDGNVDDNIDPAAIAFIKKLAPLDGIRRITELAFKMRMAVQWMDQVQDEDF